MIVDLLHETENTVRFGTFGQYDDYFFGVFGVPARAVENRYAPVYVMVYAISYLLVFVGEDKELYRLSYTVDNQVARIVETANTTKPKRIFSKSWKIRYDDDIMHKSQ